MKKIPTLFERDWNGDRSRVTDKVNPKCQWVIDGEGVATRKLDGTSCLVRDGSLLKRRELRDGDIEPFGFELADYDHETKKRVGWVPVEPANPADRYHVEAFTRSPGLADGTYELIGPKVQGNPENVPSHELVAHTMAAEFPDAPRTFEGLREWLADFDGEGLVWHHPDGRMAKIKLRDFGIKRPKS